MENNIDLVSVFTGTIVDVTSRRAFLLENGIEADIRNDYQSSMDAGWVAPMSNYDVHLMVKENDLNAAEKYLREYKSTIK